MTIYKQTVVHLQIQARVGKTRVGVGQIRVGQISDLFRNHFELLSLIPPTTTLPQSIHVSVVDAMRVVRLIPVSNLKPRTFKYWAINVLNHLNLLPGAEIHVVHETHSKNRDTSE